MESSTENVTLFCSITGASSDIATSLLTLCNDNLEMAINRHMEGKSNKNEKSSSDVRAPIPPKQQTLLCPSFSNLSKVARVRSVFDGFRNFGSEQSFNVSGGHKLQTLEELFKPPLEIIFHGDFQAARDQAYLKNKWLLVNIQDAGEFQCQILNRDVWSQPNVKKLLRNHFIFWQQYKESEEAQKYLTFYSVDSWPYVAVLDPRTGEKLVTWKPISSAIFEELVSDFISLQLNLKKEEKDKKDDSDTVKHSKAQKRKYEDRICNNIVDANEEEQIEAAIQASLLSSQRLSHNDQTDESSSSSWEDYLGNDGDSKSKLLIRFPDGIREVKELSSSSKLNAILLYVKSRGFSSDSYEIVTNFPKKILGQLNENLTLLQAGLYPQETIYVQKR